MTAETRLTPGAVPLAGWRDIFLGANVALDPACRTKVEAAAATIEAIVAKGEPIYGVNTGFGKLASARIGKDDLAALQRNIVLSHAAGVGEPIPEKIARLVMALKVASLAQGASGVRWTTVEHLLECLRRGLIPLIPSQGLGRRLWRPRAARPSRRRADRRRRHLHRWRARAGRRRLAPRRHRAAARSAPRKASPSSTARRSRRRSPLAGLFEAEKLFAAALVAGALSTDAAKGSDAPFDARIQALRGQRGQIEVAAALRALLAGQRHPQLAPRSAMTGCRTPIACAASRR